SLLNAIAALFLLPVAAPLPCLSAEEPVEIDYIVFYTPAAEVRAGGEEAILTRINNGVAIVNDALARSGLGHISYRLVHVRRLSGNNTSTDLSSASQEVYQLDPILEIRDQYRADAVSILFEQIFPGAYGSIPLSAGQAKNSITYFGVFNYGGLTTAHELGHNMGGFHDNPTQPEPPEGTVLYGSSAYGYNFLGQDGVQYKTIMSYGIQPDPNNPVQIVSSGHYSNPSISFQGHPTGRDGYADMAAAIRYWAPIISTTNQPIRRYLPGPIHLLLTGSSP
ncbi:MAG: hypothetical protein M8357_16060, partial [Desulfobulbaceae bacterium]|nr:hypothetical protein [Desulfobulbaceae bacterium]